MLKMDQTGRLAWLTVAASLLVAALAWSALGNAQASDSVAAATPDAVTHVRIVRAHGDIVRDGRWAFLITALDRTIAEYGPYEIDADWTRMSTQREINEVIAGRLVDVIASDTGHPDLNNGAIPIPVPIDKGLLGYRVALILQGQQPKFDAIHDVAGLRTLRIGQGEDWGDLPIYRLAGIPIVTASRYDLLFPMLVDGRFDMFPRGVVEITHELKAFRARYPHMAIESHLLIRYPYAQFFYVSPTQALLAKRIRAGLEAMLKDGSFDALFNQHFAQSIADLHLARRVLIDLKNPLLPSWVPLARKELWLDPVGGKKPDSSE